jgi:hypothetical protein
MAEKAEVEVRVVKMKDGRTVEFSGKKKLIKSSDPSTLTVRFDWDNGETTTFVIPQDLVAHAACHGIEQKGGDEIAGLKNEDGTPADTDDCQYTVEELFERLGTEGDNGWNLKREGGGGGVSILAKALCEFTKKPIAVIKAYLKEKTQKEKTDLRHSEELEPIVQRLEKEKRAKGPKTDVKALLQEAGSLAS